MVRLYVGVTRLAELESEGQRFAGISWQAPASLQSGSSGQSVRQLQYMLNVVSQFVNSIPTVAEDGIFGEATQNAVRAFQRFAGLTVDGVVGPATWNALYERVVGIGVDLNSVNGQYPGTPLRLGDTDF